jgi:hypothetical protein
VKRRHLRSGLKTSWFTKQLQTKSAGASWQRLKSHGEIAQLINWASIQSTLMQHIPTQQAEINAKHYQLMAEGGREICDRGGNPYFAKRIVFAGQGDSE